MTTASAARSRLPFRLWSLLLLPAAAAWPASKIVGALPLAFESNEGQAGAGVRFLARSPGFTLLLEESGSAMYVLPGPSGGTAGLLRLIVEGGAGRPAASGEELLASRTNFYGGSDPRRWRESVPNYRAVRFTGVYDGIDLRWRSESRQIEYEFLLQPGAEPGAIGLRFAGARRVRLAREGHLLVDVPAGTLRFRRPLAYQEASGRRVAVPVSYSLAGARASFRVGPYDRRRPLIIDPVVSFSTYLGGGGFDAAYGVAMNSSGEAYVTGETASADFPGTPTRMRSGREAFVTRLKRDGSAVLYTTILASGSDDAGAAIAVGASGEAYVAGVAGGSGFPVTPGALQTTFPGAPAGFVARLDNSGRLVYCTYLGGGTTSLTGIAVDSGGNAYVTGYTSAVGFPVTPSAPQAVLGGGWSDALLVKLAPDGSRLLYSTLLGGAGADVSRAVAVDAAGRACIAGTTDSRNLAVRSALQAQLGGGSDAFLGCLNPAGTAWAYLTYLGGGGQDKAQALALDAAGNAYVAGATYSQNFPVSSTPFQSANHGGYDAFVSKVDAAGGGLLYSTLLGGGGADSAQAIAVDAGGRAWVAGFTASLDFPIRNAWQARNAGGFFDAFVAQFSPDGASVLFSSYLGNVGDDRATALALDGAGNALVAGYTGSVAFPTTAGVAQSRVKAPYDAFLTRLSPDALISGRVSLAGGQGLSGVAVALSGSQTASTVTDVSGYYSFAGVPAGGTVTVTPKLAGFTFAPVSQTFTSSSGSRVADFTATPVPVYYSISGRVTDLTGSGLPGVTVALSGGGTSSVTTDATGGYLFDSLTAGATYTITPARSGYSFTPASQTFPGISGNSVANFSASVITPSGGSSKVGVFRNGQWTLDFNGNGVWDGAAGDRLVSLGQTGDIPVVGDWNGTHSAKAGIFRNGLWVLDYNGNGVWDGPALDRAMMLGQTGDTPVVGDWNGDGRAKAGIFRNGLWVLDYNGNGVWDGPAVDRAYAIGQAGDIPVVGDWNGDGRAKVGVFRNGQWTLDYNGNGVWEGPAGDRLVSLGQTGDIPVVGDWNGTHSAKPGIFRNGLWVLDYNGNGVWDGPAVDRAMGLGQAGDIPVVGDWNGDGRAKVGIFRNGLWVLDYNGNGVWDGPAVDRAYAIGQTGDRAVTGAW